MKVFVWSHEIVLLYLEGTRGGAITVLGMCLSSIDIRYNLPEVLTNFMIS